MDFMVKMARFRIKQNVLNLRSTLSRQLTIDVMVKLLPPCIGPDKVFSLSYEWFLEPTYHSQISSEREFWVKVGDG